LTVIVGFIVPLEKVQMVLLMALVLVLQENLQMVLLTVLDGAARELADGVALRFLTPALSLLVVSYRL